MAAIPKDLLPHLVEVLQKEPQIVVKETFCVGGGERFWAMEISSPTKLLLEYKPSEGEREVFLRIGEERRTVRKLSAQLLVAERKTVELSGEALDGLVGFLAASEEAVLRIGSPAPPWLAEVRTREDYLIAKGEIGQELAQILDGVVGVDSARFRYFTFYGKGESDYQIRYEVVTPAQRKILEGKIFDMLPPRADLSLE